MKNQITYPSQIFNFIDDQFQQSKESQTFVKKLPFDEQNISVVNSCSMDLVQSLQGANKAFNDWRSSTIEDRLLLIDRIQNYLIENKLKFAELESLDQGLSVSFSMVSNIEVAIQKMSQLKYELEEGVASHLDVLPIGVVGVILSWNLSTRLFVENVIPAILAGNAVVVKISSYAPVTAYLWGELFQNIGLPSGLVQIMHSQDQQFKMLFISHPSIKAICATMDLNHATNIYKTIASLSKQQFKKLQIHSGSKNTCAFLKDPNEIEMKNVVDSFLLGQGQLHWNNARLFILEKNEKIWIEFIQNYLNELKPSESIYDSSVWTPILKTESIHQFQTIISQAKADQAKVLTSSCKPANSKFLNAFFTKDMSNCSVLQQDQVSGPAFIVSIVKYPFDIPKYSNVSYYGFSADIWTEEGKNKKVIQQLEVGHVSVNRWNLHCIDSIYGVKQSAFGQTDRKIFGSFFSNVKKMTQ